MSLRDTVHQPCLLLLWTVPMTFTRQPAGRIRISDGALQMMLGYCQHGRKDPEAGGILLGRLISEAVDVVIDTVTVPGPTDRRSRFSFFRDRKRTQQEVTQAWSESAATRVYLGEWHSHPEDCPEPSGQDLKNWRLISERSKYEQNFLLFLIVGRTGLRLWEFEKGRNQPVELQREALSIQR